MVPVLVHSSNIHLLPPELDAILKRGGWGLPQENGAFQAPFLQDWDPVAPRQQPVTHAYMIILAASQIRLFCGSRH